VNAAEHNSRVRQWVNCQPVSYQKVCAAFAYPADYDTCNHSFTLASLVKLARRNGNDISRKTLVRRMPTLERYGLLRIVRRKAKGKQLPSIYTIDFTKIIPAEESVTPAERDQIIRSVTSVGLVQAPMPDIYAAAEARRRAEMGCCGHCGECSNQGCRCLSCKNTHKLRAEYKRRAELAARN
jgi:hypothetical protein